MLSHTNRKIAPTTRHVAPGSTSPVYRDITHTLQTNESGTLLYDEEHILAECYGTHRVRFVMRDGALRLERRDE
jgi:hypothetical protein